MKRFNVLSLKTEIPFCWNISPSQHYFFLFCLVFFSEKFVFLQKLHWQKEFSFWNLLKLFLQKHFFILRSFLQIKFLQVSANKDFVCYKILWGYFCSLQKYFCRKLYCRKILWFFFIPKLFLCGFLSSGMELLYVTIKNE